MSERAELDLIVVGANHRTADPLLRDRLFIDEAAEPAFLARLRDEAGLCEALLLSTCDRVEVQGLARDPGRAIAATRRMFAETVGMAAETLAAHVYALTGEEALRQLFAVPAGLDSQIVGESQVAGQVRAAHARARAGGHLGAELDRLLQEAYATAKRVRAETEIGEAPVSLAAAASGVARDLFGDPAGCRLLVVGLGDIGELMLTHFRQAGIGGAELTGPSRRTASEGRRLGLSVRAFEDLETALAHSDIVVTAGGLGRTLISADQVDRALRRRRNRPILLIDGSVPGDIDAGVDDFSAAFLYRLDDIERLALSGRRSREEAAHAAWAILEEALERHRRRGAERDAIPALVALRGHFEAERARLLAEHPDADAAEATRLLVRRLLHRPSEALRAIAGDGGSADMKDSITVNRVLQRLFELDPDAGDKDDGHNP